MKKIFLLFFIIFFLLNYSFFLNNSKVMAGICSCSGECNRDSDCPKNYECFDACRMGDGCYCLPNPAPAPTNPPRPIPTTPPGQPTPPNSPITPTVPPDDPNCGAPCSCPGGPPPLYGYCFSPDCHGGLVCWNSGNSLSCESCYDKGVDVALYFFEDRNFNGIWDSNEWLIDPSNSTNHDYGDRHNYGAFAQTKTIGTFPQIRVQNIQHPDIVADLEKHPDFIIHPFEGNPCRATGFLGLREVLHDPNSESKTAISSYWTRQVSSGSVCCSDGSCGSAIAFSNMLNEWGTMPDCCEYFHEYYYMTPAVAYGVATFPRDNPGTAQIQITPPAGWTLSRNSYSRLGFGPMGNHHWGYQEQKGDWYITAIGLVAAPQIISLTKPSYLYLYQEGNFVATFSHPWGADTIQAFQFSIENQPTQPLNQDGTVNYDATKWFVNIDVNINNNILTAWVGDGEISSTSIRYIGNKGYISSDLPIKHDDQTIYATLIGGENNTYFIKQNNNITVYFKIRFEKIPLENTSSFNTTLYVEDDNYYDDEIAERSPSNLIQVAYNSSENGNITFHRMGQIEIRKPPNCKNLKLNNVFLSSPRTVLLGDTVELSAEYEQNFSYVRIGVDSSNCSSPAIQTTITSTPGEYSFNWTASALGTYNIFCGAGISSPSIECRGRCYSPPNSYLCFGSDGNGSTTWGTINVTLPGPWYKLKNTSLNKIGNHEIAVVQNIKKFTNDDPDDTTDRYTIINSSNSDPGILLATGNYNPRPPYNPIPASNKNWYIGNYGNISQPFLNGLTNFYSYIKSRKQIKEIAAISDINANGIYLIKTNSLTINTNPNYNFVLIVRNSNDSDFGKVNIEINNFNSNEKSIMILAKDITFSSSTVYASGIFIATNQVSYQSNNGLKIKGNLISTNAITLQPRSDNTRPSLFVVFKPQMYLNLLPYLSVSKYDWQQLQ